MGGKYYSEYNIQRMDKKTYDKRCKWIKRFITSRPSFNLFHIANKLITTKITETGYGDIDAILYTDETLSETIAALKMITDVPEIELIQVSIESTKLFLLFKDKEDNEYFQVDIDVVIEEGNRQSSLRRFNYLKFYYDYSFSLFATVIADKLGLKCKPTGLYLRPSFTLVKHIPNQGDIFITDDVDKVLALLGIHSLEDISTLEKIVRLLTSTGLLTASEITLMGSNKNITIDEITEVAHRLENEGQFPSEDMISTNITNHLKKTKYLWFPVYRKALKRHRTLMLINQRLRFNKIHALYQRIVNNPKSLFYQVALTDKELGWIISSVRNSLIDFTFNAINVSNTNLNRLLVNQFIFKLSEKRPILISKKDLI